MPEAEPALAVRGASRPGLADLAYHQTRVAISGLHSLVLDDLGLVAALESLVQMSAGAESASVDSNLRVSPSDPSTTSPTTRRSRATGSPKRR